ncbi:unnamed protein product, partial [Cyprideis torosa]
MVTKLPSKHGDFDVFAYQQLTTGDTHIAITRGNWQLNEPILVRAHSSTETGDEIGFLFGDYGRKLDNALRKIAEAEKGILLLMRHREKDEDILVRLRELAEGKPKQRPSQETEQRDYGV